MLGSLYRALWMRVGGRPWTYILRDAWHRVEGLWLLGLLAVGAVLGHWLWERFFWLPLAFGLGYVAGHLFWGKEYVAGQRGGSGGEVQ